MPLAKTRFDALNRSGAELDLPNFPQDFHRPSQTMEADLEPLARKWRTTNYLYRMETLWQAQENNTTFIFWLLPRGIPRVPGQKVRESEVQRPGGRGQGSVSFSSP
jgi:hypothetical protein